jgi:hypothetical protein
MVTLFLPYDWLSFGERCREVEPEDYYLTVDSLDPAIIAFAPVAGSKDPRWVESTNYTDKKENEVFLIYKEIHIVSYPHI